MREVLSLKIFFQWLSPVEIPSEIGMLPAVQDLLSLAEGVDYKGQMMSGRHLDWEEVNGLAQAIEREAKSKTLSRPAILGTIRSWNYRANKERERFNRGAAFVDAESVSTEQVVDASVKALSRATVEEIFSVVNRPPP